ncbi:MAG: D-tyrosyl-tRNA(Tyr) deacylase [Xanthomonadales bacterium]|nr:D-tyrosyl-tRNA(Tyr) deacylase [Xanthomonadales bacterium]|tara:strand:+ start:200 stop:637 length:438 start_codon:yes stop_codon:yes gene_type:complete
MIGLIQRARHAWVDIDDTRAAEIDAGLVVLVCAVPDDTPERATRLAERILAYRVFGDDSGRMNIGVRDAGHAVLAVPQFTLAADTARGNRPGFSGACPPARARGLFDDFVSALSARHEAVATGRFGADMQVGLVNDGPVTFWLTS